MAEYESVEGCIIELQNKGLIIWPAKTPPQRVTASELYELKPKIFKTRLGLQIPKGSYPPYYKFHIPTQTWLLIR